MHRLAHLDERVDWLRSPPRVRLPEAVIDVCLAHPEPLTCDRILADACQTWLTTPDHLAAALSGRARVTGRAQLREMIDDLRTGACSVLERGYLALERRHGLPAADRQRSDLLPSGRVYRDVPYAAYGVLVELDGRAFHDTASARDHDLERDLDTQVTADGITVRLGFGQVFGRGCATIGKVAALLTRRGWPGPFLGCPGCP